MTKIKIKLMLKLLIAVLFVYLFLFYLVLEVLFSQNRFKMATETKVREINLSQVIVHFDLKGAPPKLEYLTSLLPLLKGMGATGLLMEYEDMFPYEGKLVNLSARNCYDKKELARFIKTAISIGLDVIPLVQTFGHLESALKLQEFQHLREEPAYPDSICPSKVESRALINHMLEQVLDFHKKLYQMKFAHIGCDEVFHINSCITCRNRMLDNEDIFLQHLIVTSADIKRKYPNTTVLIWDDMLRGIPPLVLEQYNLRGYNIEPVIWDYRPQVDITHMTIFKYYKNFDNIWIASAFKGANKKTSTLVDYSNRLRNHLSWMKFIDGYKMAGTNAFYNFRGIFLTGWSRFSHFDPLCEILPASIQSLFISLLTVQEFTHNYDLVYEMNDGGGHIESKIIYKMKIILECTNLENKDLGDNVNLDGCRFAEYEVIKTLLALNHTVCCIIREINYIYFVNGDLSEFYIKTGHVNPNAVVKIDKTLEPLLLKINGIANNLTKAMQPYFHDEVIKEYVYFKTMPALNMIKKILKSIEILKKVQTWIKGPSIYHYDNQSLVNRK